MDFSKSVCVSRDAEQPSSDQVWAPVVRLDRRAGLLGAPQGGLVPVSVAWDMGPLGADGGPLAKFCSPP